MKDLFDNLLVKRGLLSKVEQQAFLEPDYLTAQNDPFLLPDMSLAVDRIVLAKQQQQKVFIYGDYDIDGLTATTILQESLKNLGLEVSSFIPNRFVDGYGLSQDAIKQIVDEGAQLIITVDCGSLSHLEIDYANSLNVDVIVTDHHSVADTMPAAVAVINPKRSGHQYPFTDLAGCGVAFKLVQALQTRISGIQVGQEKWLLDLVALGTVCDVVSLTGENRANVYWGLKVLAQTRRPGIKALSAVTGLKMNEINSRSLGFVLGPHLNASGRLDTARLSLDLLTTKDPSQALEIAYKLQEMNVARRAEQHRITNEAKLQAQNYLDQPVLVLSDPNWSHGIIGIVAARMLEIFQKPTFVLQEIGDISKGSARSYGDFSAVEGIDAVKSCLIKGGGHKLAAGVTLKTVKIDAFRQALNQFYLSLNLIDQKRYLNPIADLVIPDLSCLNMSFNKLLKKLEPFGHGNPEPVFCVKGVTVVDRRTMGADKQHLKLQIIDAQMQTFYLVGFGQSERFSVAEGDVVDVWFSLVENEWRGLRSLEGRLLDVALCELNN